MRNLEKLTKELKVELMFDLINSFRIVEKPIETAHFLQDLLTANEIRNLSIRLRIAKLLLSGEKHRDISNSLHTSLATIAKVKAWLDRGGDGLENVITKLPVKYEMPDKLPRKPVEFQLPQTLLALAQYSFAKGSEKQRKQAENLIKGAYNKKKLDRSLQKLFNEYYKAK